MVLSFDKLKSKMTFKAKIEKCTVKLMTHVEIQLKKGIKVYVAYKKPN